MPKFHNKKVRTEFGDFDSRNEYRRFLYLLKALERGEIRGLERQTEFELLPTQYYTKTIQLKTKTKEVQRVAEKAVMYKADFTYTRTRDDAYVVEDFKGFITKEYVLKRKLMNMIGYPIRQVTKPDEPV